VERVHRPRAVNGDDEQMLVALDAGELDVGQATASGVPRFTP